MADTVAEMAVELREALSLDNSHDVSLEALTRRCIKRFLRDYHFPKALVLTEFKNILADTQSYDLPAGFKKEYLVRFYDPAEEVYDLPMFKREHPVKVEADGRARYYWVEGNKLFTDVTIDADSAGVTLQVYHESMDITAAEAWIVTDFEDVLFSYCMYRAAGQKRKAELKKEWHETWKEDRTSLAIYLNELEFGNGEYMMNASSPSGRTSRYAPSAL